MAGYHVIRKEEGLFNRTSSSVRLWWEFKEPTGPKGLRGGRGERGVCRQGGGRDRGEKGHCTTRHPPGLRRTTHTHDTLCTDVYSTHSATASSEPPLS
jgi:hypothetical protein